MGDDCDWTPPQQQGLPSYFFQTGSFANVRNRRPSMNPQDKDVCVRITHLLNQRDFLKQEVHRCFDQVDVEQRGALSLQGLVELCWKVEKVTFVPTGAFGNFPDTYSRFDFNGDGTLDKNEAYKCIKYCLKAYRKALGGQAVTDVPHAAEGPSQLGYRVIKVLASGGQGTASLVQNSQGAEFVQKSYDKSNANAGGIDELMDEMEVMQAMAKCPQIASSVEVFQDSNNFYLISFMNYGGDWVALKERAVEQGISLTDEWYKSIFGQAFVGLEHMHRNAVMHCDIKEQNLMIRNRDLSCPEVVIIDLGLAHALFDEGGVFGTPGYIPPETWAFEKWFPKGDVFSMGVVCFQMLTGEDGLFVNGARTMEDVDYFTQNRQPRFGKIGRKRAIMEWLPRTLEKKREARLNSRQVLNMQWFAGRETWLPNSIDEQTQVVETAWVPTPSPQKIKEPAQPVVKPKLGNGMVAQDITKCEQELASARARFAASRVASKEALSRLGAVDQGFKRHSRLLHKIGEEAAALQEQLSSRSNTASAKSSPARSSFFGAASSPALSSFFAHDDTVADVDVPSYKYTASATSSPARSSFFARDDTVADVDVPSYKYNASATGSLARSSLFARDDTATDVGVPSHELAASRDKEKLEKANLEIAELVAAVHEQERAVETAHREAACGAAEEVKLLRAELREIQESKVAEEIDRMRQMVHTVSLKDKQLNNAKAALVAASDNYGNLIEAQRSEAFDIEQLRIEFEQAQANADKLSEFEQNSLEAEEKAMKREEELKLMMEANSRKLEEFAHENAELVGTIASLESEVTLAVEIAQNDAERRRAETLAVARRDMEHILSDKLERLRGESNDSMAEVEARCMEEKFAKEALESQVARLQADLVVASQRAAEERSRDELYWKENADTACAEAKRKAEEEIESVRMQCQQQTETALSEAKSQFIEEVATLEARCNRLKEENAEASQRRREDEVVSTPSLSSPRGPGGTLNVPVQRGPLSPRGARASSASSKQDAARPQAKKSMIRSSTKELGVRFQDDSSDDSEGAGEYDNRSSVAESEFWVDSGAVSWSRAGSLLLHQSDDSEEEEADAAADADDKVTEIAGLTLLSQSPAVAGLRRATSVPPNLGVDARESLHQEARRSKARDSATVQALDLPRIPKKSISSPHLGERSYGSTKSVLSMRDRFSTNPRGTVSRTATSEEYGQCLSDGIMKALQLKVLHEFGNGEKPSIDAFKDVRTLDLVATAGRAIEFEFEVVAPDIFRDLRRNAFGVEDESFAASIGLHPLSGGRQGEGKSGSLFFFSSDKRYIVKTTDAVEVPFFLDGLDLYHEYMRGKDAGYLPAGGRTSSFLPRYSGFFGLKILNDVKAYLVVFENIFPPDVPLKEKYDLKGVLGKKRNVSEEELKKGIEVLKDRNFLNRTLNVGEKMKQRLADQLKKDVNFLEERGRIDYSLLLGVASLNDLEDKPHADVSLQWPTIECHGLRSIRRGEVLGDEVFFLGIIDVLQEYTKKKVAENKLRSLKHGITHMLKSSAHADSSNAVSAVPPPQYAKRFYDFLVSRME